MYSFQVLSSIKPDWTCYIIQILTLLGKCIVIWHKIAVIIAIVEK